MLRRSYGVSKLARSRCARPIAAAAAARPAPRLSASALRLGGAAVPAAARRLLSVPPASSAAASASSSPQAPRPRAARPAGFGAALRRVRGLFPGGTVVGAAPAGSDAVRQALRRGARWLSSPGGAAAGEQQQQQQQQGEQQEQQGSEKPPKEPLPQSLGISLWLFACAGVVFFIVAMGGATRLTRSGLSMTDWKPQGSLPPQTDEEWQVEFERYQKFPEYQKLNKGMTLSEFKFIYYMEWSHRMAGRFAGVLFGVPLLALAARGRLAGRLGKRLALLLGMGATQGAVGWWMVKSGLKEREDDPYWTPRVSPYRLATHLLSAVAIYSLLLDTALKTFPARAGSFLYANRAGVPRRFRALAVGAAHLVGLTMASGAFVAGNQAGLVYNEWPLMGGRIVPEDIISPYLTPKWRNIFENSSLVQFDHRMLAYGSVAAVSATWLRSASVALPPNARIATNLFLGATLSQVGLGITTLLTMVPVQLGVAHQLLALLTLTSGLTALHTYGGVAASGGSRMRRAAEAASRATKKASAFGGAPAAGGPASGAARRLSTAAAASASASASAPRATVVGGRPRLAAGAALPSPRARAMPAPVAQSRAWGRSGYY